MLNLIQYAGQIDAVATDLLNRGVPVLVVTHRCLGLILTDLQAGKDAAAVAADLYAAWKAGTLGP